MRNLTPAVRSRGPLFVSVAVALAALLAACSDATGPTGAADPDVPDGAPVTIQNVDKALINAALIDAAWANDVPRARAFIAAGADVNHEDETQQSAYLIATSEGYLELLELTFAHGADVRALDSYNGTGLIRAAERGHAAVVGRLLRTNIDVNHVNTLGWTALHEAIIFGDGTPRYVDTVRLLAARGADVTLPSARDGKLPLDHAASNGQQAMVRTLRTAFATPPLTDPNRELLDAAAAGDADRIALALRNGADLETRDRNQRTPLLLAVTNDQVDAARILVALGADADALDDRHDTPWLVTGVTGSVAMADVLLAAQPDLTIRNRFGGISIIPASERGYVDYVRRVVDTAIDVNHVNDLGWTALLEAVIFGDGSERYQQIVEILLDAGADRRIADKNGVTALEHARASGQTEVARILSA